VRHATSASSPGASKFHAHADAAERAAGDEDGAVRSRRKQGQHSQGQLDSSQQGGRKAPQFTVASASSSIDIPSGAPAWRVMVGNLAAGATAGCAVEAGEPAVRLAGLCCVRASLGASATRDQHKGNLCNIPSL